MSTALAVLSEAECRCIAPLDEPGFGALATEKGNLPLKALDVSGEIVGLVAQVAVKQTFVNVHDEPLEATYIFPLPDRAAVSKFQMIVGRRTIDGVLKERGEARREYDRAIQAGHRAAIAEEERPGTFTMRVGNLMPGEEASVLLKMTSPLLYADGEATFRFPLVVAPRYIPGAALPEDPVGDGVAQDTDAVPDASRISPPVLLPGFRSPVRLGIALDIDPAGLPMGEPRSSLSAIELNGKSKRSDRAVRRVMLKAGQRLDRDFILRFPLAEKAVRTSLVLKADEDGQGGTFMLTLMPPSPKALATRPRDVVFVLDRSGSMEGWKMVAARRAVARIVDSLNDHDRFAVLAFDDQIETPPALGPGLVAATDRNRFRAVEFLAKVDSRGGTEMLEPLDRAAQELAGGKGRDQVIILATDGQVGNEDQIVQALGRRVAGMRVYTVGIDTAVNEGFLKRLAALGGGAFELVESEDRLDEVMDKIHRRFGSPVLTEVSMRGAEGLALEKDTLVPARHSALFAGTPLVVTGRYRGKASGAIAVQAKDAAGRPWRESIEAVESPNDALQAIWARGRVRDLEDRYAVQAGDRLARQIVETSLTYGVLCRFTAFVAVDHDEVVNRGGKQHRATQAVEQPHGWGASGGGAPEAEECEKAEVSKSPVSRSRSAPRQALMEPEPCADMLADSPPAAAAPAPSSARRKTTGLLGSILGRGDKGDRCQPVQTIDLAPYRRRAGSMAEALGEARSDEERLVALGAIGVQLEALVEDLRSVGAEPDAVAALEELRVEIDRLLAREKPSAAAIAKLAGEARKALEAFAKGKEVKGGVTSRVPPQDPDAGPAPQGKRRGGSFWK